MLLPIKPKYSGKWRGQEGRWMGGWAIFFFSWGCSLLRQGVDGGYVAPDVLSTGKVA